MPNLRMSAAIQCCAGLMAPDSILDEGTPRHPVDFQSAWWADARNGHDREVVVRAGYRCYYSYD